MNVEKICSPYTDPAALEAMLDNSYPEFRRGVFDMCTAFNFKADYPKNAGSNDVILMTPNGWSAGRLSYIGTDRTGEAPFFRYTSRAIRKMKSDSRTDRGSRAANKIKDLIKVLRLKDEIITDENAFNYEHQAIRYAFGAIKSNDQTPPVMRLESHLADAAMRAAFGIADLDVTSRTLLEQVYRDHKEKVAKCEESHSAVKRFRRSTAVGICNYWGDTHYFVGKVNIVKDAAARSSDYDKIELQAPMKRYTTLANSEIATDAAIIRTYMQGTTRYEADNELGMGKGDKYYDEIDVATGYGSDTMLWVLMPEQGE